MDASDFESARSRIPEVSAALTRMGEPYADVFLHELEQSTAQATVTARGSRFGPVQTKSDVVVTSGMGLRTLRSDLVGFSATADLSSEGISKAISSPGLRPTRIADEPAPQTRLSRLEDEGELSTLARSLLDLCAAAHDDLARAEARVSRIATRRAVAPTGGPLLEDRSLRLEVRASIRIGGLEVSSVASTSRPADAGDLLEAVAANLVTKARIRTVPRHEIVGDLPVVLRSGWGGVWLHEAVGHQLEADSVGRGASSLADRIGETVADDCVTILDSGIARGGRVSLAFDDEGVACTKTVLVENGRLVGILSDRSNSMRTGLPLTGNARRAHYAQLPRPRMTNLYLDPGLDEPGDLMSDIRKGLLVNDIDHAWFEPRSGLIHLSVLEAQIIENGVVTEQAAPVILSGSPLTVLRGIERIANDFQFDQNRGYCRKDSIAIPVGVGQPTVLIRSMNVRAAATSVGSEL